MRIFIAVGVGATACRATLMLCKVLAATGTQNQIDSLRGQIDSLRLTAIQATDQLTRSVNPADVSFTTATASLHMSIQMWLCVKA